MSEFQKLKKLLHGNLDVYENFDHTQYQDTLSPGSMPANELLQYIVSKENPNLIIEVGSWLGWSAFGMSSEMKKTNPEGVTICVDSWMGGCDHWESTINHPESKIRRKNGYPTFYYNFLANMCYSGMQETVLPLAYPSVTAAKILEVVFKQNNISADMIYIDGSHEYWDVMMDLMNYWPLLKDRGLIFGDDWTSYLVRDAVTDFCKNNQLNLEVAPNNVHWFIRK